MYSSLRCHKEPQRGYTPTKLHKANSKHQGCLEKLSSLWQKLRGNSTGTSHTLTCSLSCSLILQSPTNNADSNNLDLPAFQTNSAALSEDIWFWCIFRTVFWASAQYSRLLFFLRFFTSSTPTQSKCGHQPTFTLGHFQKRLRVRSKINGYRKSCDQKVSEWHQWNGWEQIRTTKSYGVDTTGDIFKHGPLNLALVIFLINSGNLLVHEVNQCLGTSLTNHWCICHSCLHGNCWLVEGACNGVNGGWCTRGILPQMDAWKGRKTSVAVFNLIQHK